MNHHVSSIIAAAAIGLCGCAGPGDMNTAPLEVTLTERADGQWQVDFDFADPQDAIVFLQAGEPYRAPEWTSLTAGVEVVTKGAIDVMHFAEPSATASFLIEPHTNSIRKAYTPFLGYTDGGWGVLAGQFRVAEARGLEEVESFTGTADDWGRSSLPYRLTIRSANPILYRGEWAEGELTIPPESDDVYTYVGDGAVTEGANFVGVIDEGLPNWIRERLDTDLGAIFEQLSDEWQVTLPERAEILFVYDGNGHEGLSQTGGTLGYQLALQVSGRALDAPDASIVDHFRWFLAHEAAHLFQTAGGMGEVPDDHAWMHEGVANTMSHRIGGRLAEDREAFLSEAYGEAFETCTSFLEQGVPLTEALVQREFNAFYACGDFVALVTEAGLEEGDIFDFWRGFLGRAASGSGGALSTALYFRTARDFGVAPDTVRWMQRFVERPVDDPRETLSTALAEARLAPEFDADGHLIGLSLPQ